MIVPQLIGRGETVTEERRLNASPQRVWAAVIAAAAADARLKLDVAEEAKGRLGFVTKANMFGWGERIAIRIGEETGPASSEGSPGTPGATRLTIEVSGRQRNGFLQLERSRSLARALANRTVSELPQ